MAKKEYFDGKFAWFFKMAGCISVNRSIKDTEASNQALELLKEGKVVVDVLKSNDTWFGVTYKEDKDSVKESIASLIQQGVYPNNIH